MKIAKVTEVRDVPLGSKLGDLGKRTHIEALLRRYPATSEAETGEIRHFLATGSHLDIGLVAGSDEFRDKVAAFRKEHRRHFSLKVHEILVFLLVTGGPIGTLAWRYLG